MPWRSAAATRSAAPFGSREERLWLDVGIIPRPEQVTKITIFVARYRREYLLAIEAGRVALFGEHKPADTLVGVEALSRPEYLIEVDAIAVA